MLKAKREPARERQATHAELAARARTSLELVRVPLYVKTEHRLAHANACATLALYELLREQTPMPSQSIPLGGPSGPLGDPPLPSPGGRPVGEPASVAPMPVDARSAFGWWRNQG